MNWKVVVLVALLSLSSTSVGVEARPGLKSFASDLGCDACILFFDVIQGLVRSNATTDFIEGIAVNICISQKIYGGDASVCQGAVSEFGPEIIYILTRKFIDPKTVCTTLKACDATVNLSEEDQSKFFAAAPSQRTQQPADVDIGTIIQLSDIHFDAEYTPGNNADCGRPLCCRSFDGPANSSASSAGLWGDYRCDLPLPSLDSLFAHLAKTVASQAPDFVLWTGDDPPHNVWNQSRAFNLAAAQAITERMYATFTDFNVPVWPAVGNHENFPVDQFQGPDPETGGDNWLYTALANMWLAWLPEDAQTSFRSAGYYTALMGPKHRIISMNNMYGFSSNFWLILDDNDRGGHLAWLEQQLSAARANQETVWLVGHASPASVLDKYAQSLHTLVDTYSDIIAAQFFGHTHNDELLVYRDVATGTKPIGVGFIAPSITTYTDRNPSFRVYKYDRNTKQVLDYEVYTLHIDQANQQNEPQWLLSYSAKQAYNMTGFAPSDFQDLMSRLNTEDVTGALWETYLTNYNQQRVIGSCDAACKKKLLCTQTSPTETLYSQCINSATVQSPPDRVHRYEF